MYTKRSLNVMLFLSGVVHAAKCMVSDPRLEGDKNPVEY